MTYLSLTAIQYYGEEMESLKRTSIARLLLLLYKKKRLYTTELTKHPEYPLSWRHLHRILPTMLREGLIKSETISNRKYYSLTKKGEALAWALLNPDALADLYAAEETARVITREIVTKHIRREEFRVRTETHAAGICFRVTQPSNKWEVLLGKRRKDRKVFPGMWDCGGGQVLPHEGWEEAVKRHLLESFGAIVEVFKTPFGVPVSWPYEFPSNGEKVKGVVFVCKFIRFKNGKPSINTDEYTNCRWHDVSQLDKIDGIIPKLREEIKTAIKLLDSYRRSFIISRVT